jgi:hypothetical protein
VADYVDFKERFGPGVSAVDYGVWFADARVVD